MIVYCPRKTEIFVNMARCGFNQRSLSKASGLNPATVSTFINGKRNISPTSAKRIADALNCDLSDIFEIKLKGENHNAK